MKKILSLLLATVIGMSVVACDNDEPSPEFPKGDDTENPETPTDPDDTDNPGSDTPSEQSKILVAYFSWGGTTRRMAQQITETTGGTMFEIEPVTPYPTSYTPCTEVALEERDSNARPAIKNRIDNWNEYDIIFIGCPVWWHEAPMIIHTFVESYDFTGKTVVPFCTYASTYRDETLAKIVEITSDAQHLPGLGLTSGSLGNHSNVNNWLQRIGIITD